MIRSPFFYVGDKYKLVEQLKTLFPKKFNRLIEPFCGGGSIFLNVTTDSYFANDKNQWMIKLHKFLGKFKGRREDFFKDFHKKIKKYNFSASFLGVNLPENFKQQYPKTHYSVFNKNAYRKAKNDFNNNKEDLMLLYVLLIYGFNHMLRFNLKGDFNLPVGNVDYNKNVYNALNSYFNFLDENEVNFSCYDFRDFLEKFDFKENDFLYLDPPYLISKCEYNKGWTEKEEIDLLKILDKLNKRNVKFAISNVFTHKGQTNSILKEWSKKYNTHVVNSNYISYFDNSIKKDTLEVLITNY